jgi:hypothetical protein
VPADFTMPISSPAMTGQDGTPFTGTMFPLNSNVSALETVAIGVAENESTAAQICTKPVSTVRFTSPPVTTLVSYA